MNKHHDRNTFYKLNALSTIFLTSALALSTIPITGCSGGNYDAVEMVQSPESKHDSYYHSVKHHNPVFDSWIEPALPPPTAIVNFHGIIDHPKHDSQFNQFSGPSFDQSKEPFIPKGYVAKVINHAHPQPFDFDVGLNN